MNGLSLRWNLEVICQGENGLPATENRQFYPALNGLRGVAVLMVFVQHYFTLPIPVQWGWSGVEIFFVLSGFLITGILFDTRGSAKRFKSFYLRRVLRIFPLYYGVLIGTILLYPIFHWLWKPAWFMWFIYAGNYSRAIWTHQWVINQWSVDHLVSGSRMRPFLFAHFWSLCVEEQFYLLWPPVVFWICNREKLRNICAGAFFICLFARVVCVLFLPPGLRATEFIQMCMPLRVDALLTGGFVALTLRGPEAAEVRSLAKPVLVGCLMLFVGMEAFYFIATGAAYRYQDRSWLETIGYSVIDLFAAALILLAVDPSTGFAKVLRFGWLMRLGAISYGFYVFHDIPRLYYARIADKIGVGTEPMTAAIGFCFTLLLASLSYAYFEKPFLRLKGRFTA